MLTSKLRSWLFVLASGCVLFAAACGGGSESGSNGDPGTPGTPQGSAFSGVLMWKGNTSGSGLFSGETRLTPQNVNVSNFGKIAEIPVDGLVIAQPLYLRSVDIPGRGSLDVVIVATEHDSVYAFEIKSGPNPPLWVKHYAVNGAIPAPDNFGGRTTLGGEVGITGTPVIDPSTGVMYFVTTLSINGVVEQWLRAIDVRTGQDFGVGSVKIQASVPGDGRGSNGGQIAFNAQVQNQRAGLTLHAGKVLIGWGSFSDFGVYHGWLMAYDAATLQQAAVFSPVTQFQAQDDANGPADHGGGGSIWQAGATPSIDASGNIYIVTADGSFNAHQGGSNFGDSVLKLQLDGSGFHVVDWFTPSNQACINEADLEIGSGGLALLPSDATAGRRTGATISKEGRLYLLDLDNLGRFNPAGDNQIPQQFLVGDKACFDGIGVDFAEGASWNRLYGNPAYWNGNLYVAPSNGTLRQYQFVNGILNTTPVAQSPSKYGFRGGNIVVSSSGNQNAIVWAYEKNASQGRAVLHAYEATGVGRELWNSTMNAGRDNMGTGHGFGTPVVADGRIIVPFDKAITIYGLLQ